MDINGASWGSIGGWKENSIIYITKNTCSNTRKFFGNAWNKIVKAFNFPNTSCPIVVVMYNTIN